MQQGSIREWNGVVLPCVPATTLKEFDIIARLETRAIDAHADAHHCHAENYVLIFTGMRLLRGGMESLVNCKSCKAGSIREWNGTPVWCFPCLVRAATTQEPGV